MKKKRYILTSSILAFLLIAVLLTFVFRLRIFETKDINQYLELHEYTRNILEKNSVDIFPSKDFVLSQDAEYHYVLQENTSEKDSFYIHLQIRFSDDEQYQLHASTLIDKASEILISEKSTYCFYDVDSIITIREKTNDIVHDGYMLPIHYVYLSQEECLIRYIAMYIPDSYFQIVPHIRADLNNIKDILHK